MIDTYNVKFVSDGIPAQPVKLSDGSGYPAKHVKEWDGTTNVPVTPVKYAGGAGKYPTWSDIGDMVRNNTIQSLLKVGDQLLTTWEDTADGVSYECPFDVVNFGNVELEDGSTVPGMFLQWHYTTPFGVVFDAPEPDNTDSNIQKYGYNRWSQSAVRQWLNSDKAKGSWWTAQSDTDVAPDMAATKDGFIKGFSEDFIAQIKPTKIITQTNTVTDSGVTDTTFDKFFLPSKNEEFLTVQATIDEGTSWGYWKRAYEGTRAVNYQNGAAAIRYSVANHTSARDVWLRSATRGASYSPWNVYSNGTVSNYIYARYGLTLAPACVIC